MFKNSFRVPLWLDGGSWENAESEKWNGSYCSEGTAIPWESSLNTCMLLVHGFQAGEIRAHVGSAPFNREGEKHKTRTRTVVRTVWQPMDKWRAANQEISDPGNLVHSRPTLEWVSFIAENCSNLHSLSLWIEVFLRDSWVFKKNI